MPGGLLDVSHQCLSKTDAHYHGELRMWRFPRGATITFGFMEAERDEYRYAGSQYQRVIYDELPQFRSD